YTSDGTGYKTLALHWNGSSWQPKSSPSPGSPNNELLGVVAVAPDDVWAVGYANMGGDGSVYQTLALHWDGLTWQVIARPDGGTGTLTAIAVPAGGVAWAVGSDTTNPSATLTLVERYRVTRPTHKLYLPLTRR